MKAKIFVGFRTAQPNLQKIATPETGFLP